MLKIVSLHVRGLEGQSKRSLVKEVLRQEDSDIVFLMETKRSGFCKRITSIWKSRRFLMLKVCLVAFSCCGIRDCVAFEVIHDRHSTTVAFLDGEGHEF